MVKLFVGSIKMLYRDRNSLFWSLAFPIIFVVVFGLFNFDQGSNVRIGVAAAQQSAVGRNLVTALEGVQRVTVSQPSSMAAGRKDLNDGKLDMLIVVPATTAPAAGQSTSLEAYYNPANVQVAPYALNAVRQVVGEMNLTMAGVTSPPLALRTQSVSTRRVSYYDWLLPGLVAMGIMNFSIMGVAVAIARFREQQIFKRVLATPLAPSRFLAAQVMARLVVALVQTSLIIGVGVLIFHGHIYGSLVWVFLLALIANVIFLNLGIAVAARATSTNTAGSISQVVVIPMMFLSGLFFPTDTLPRLLREAVVYLPLTPLIEALRKISVDGQSITATGSQLLLLGAWVVVSFVLASRTFRFSSQ